MFFANEATHPRMLDRTSNPYSLLVAGHAGDLSLNSIGEFVVKQALSEVVSLLKKEHTDRPSLIGILTGVRTRVETFAAELAHQEGLSLCLLSMGKPGSLTESQKLAQRQIWLGAEAEDIKTGLPQSIRNED
jgi:hypothetical protein